MQNRTCYIGPGIYQDWLKQKYYFPVLFYYDEFVVGENQMRLLLENIMERGFTVRNNNVRTREMKMVNMRAESFVVFDDLSKMLTTIIRRNVIRYEYGSECIFVFRAEAQRKYRFILDKRMADNSPSKMIRLFEWAKAYTNM